MRQRCENHHDMEDLMAASRNIVAVRPSFRNLMGISQSVIHSSDTESILSGEGNVDSIGIKQAYPCSIGNHA